MSASTEFGFQQLVGEILRGLSEAVTDRPGETAAQRAARHQTTVFLTMAFLPRDALETMLASQCVMLDHALRDGIRDLLRGADERTKPRLRSQLVAIGRLFLKHLTEYRLLQARPVEQIAVVPRAQTAARSDGETAAPRSAPAAGTSAPAAETMSRPPATRGDGGAALLPRHGFPNRKARRALQIKAKAAARRALRKPAAPASGSGLTGG